MFFFTLIRGWIASNGHFLSKLEKHKSSRNYLASETLSVNNHQNLSVTEATFSSANASEFEENHKSHIQSGCQYSHVDALNCIRYRTWSRFNIIIITLSMRVKLRYYHWNNYFISMIASVWLDLYNSHNFGNFYTKTFTIIVYLIVFVLISCWYRVDIVLISCWHRVDIVLISCWYTLL